MPHCMEVGCDMRPANNPGTDKDVMMTTSTGGAVRIGAVAYLNSKPLIEGLSDLLPEAELSLDYPSRLAEDLEAGQLHVALIPSIEVLRHPEYEIISDACVATRGPVMSVKLYSRVPLGEIQSLALDAGSRTSVVLARIMLEERFGVSPQLQPLPFERSLSSTETDAVLLIGDRAMHLPEEPFAVTWDLGEEWLRWTGLPFVFAVWAAKGGIELAHVEEALGHARDLGVKRAAEIARRESPILEISEATAYHYLTKNLHFRLGPAERSGLRLFSALSARLGLAPGGADLVFRDCATA
jgi:chorismate dehydratase